MDGWNVHLHYSDISSLGTLWYCGWCKNNEHSTWIVNNEFMLSTDSWIHYVWTNYYLQIVDSTIHEVFLYFNQESPSAWTQEACRPWRIKYSICFPRWGTPWPGLMGGTPSGPSPMGGTYPRLGTPGRGIPHPGPRGVPEVGYPLKRSDGWYPWWGTQVWWYPRWGTPPPGLTGVPEVLYPPPGVPPSLAGVTLPSRVTLHWTWLGYPPSGPGQGIPPSCGQTDGWMDGWTDTCQNITFPRTTHAVGNN